MPLCGRVFVSTKPPLVREMPVVSVEPSGFLIVMVAWQQVGPIFRLTRRPACPEKRSSASSPGLAIATLTGAPPATIVLGIVPETVWVSLAPPALAVVRMVTGPSVAGVYVPL